MTKPSTKVAIYGATGESGGLITKHVKKDVTALARGSGDKPWYQALASRGVKIVTIDLNDAVEVIAKSLESIDVIIAAVPPHVLETQIPTCSRCEVGWCEASCPQFFRHGTHTWWCRNCARFIIEVGWWHFSFMPKLPSGRIDWAILPEFIVNMVPGDGNMKTCLVDNLDVGPLVAKIIVDYRTLNQKVVANGDVLTLNEAFDMVEELTGEKAERKYWSAEQLDATIKQLQAAT
ncbi:Semialdhyde-dh domain-containing protein [Fusarium sp. Ph1]|nr:Semialdhyde-dh domain-containing protein [Fusarium sp. Ph1]